MFKQGQVTFTKLDTLCSFEIAS